jgi:rRNA maturation RNase YbeY
LSVSFRCGAARGRGFARALKRDAALLLEQTGLPDCELSLSLVSDHAIRKLNRDFRGKDVPTDVLSFSQVEERGKAPPDPYVLPNQPGMPLGDVVISIDTALRQARALGVSPAERLRTLLIHGFLHLLGHDHERSPAEARRMFARERRLAARLKSAKFPAQPARASRVDSRKRARQAKEP